MALPPNFSLHLIEPRDPLIVRDGKPFNAEPGARASTLPFPFPSTTTGGVRTRAGLENGSFNRSKIEVVKKIEVRGPLLVELKSSQEIGWFFPAPLDVVFLAEQSDKQGQTVKARLKRLVPADIPPGLCVGQARCGEEKLAPTAFSEEEKTDSKPASGPSFWNWEKFSQWLQNPQPVKDCDAETRASYGIAALPKDSRFHVQLREDTYTSDEGRLFGTTGLAFRVSEFKDPSFQTRRMALAVWSNEQTKELSISGGAAHLGGERRLVGWKNSNAALPSCDDWIGQIKEAGHCRVILATPAYFQSGWLPAFLLQTHEEVTPKLVAACVGRPQVVSGWDFENRTPKPTRRLAPAGSVYFLKLEGTPENIEKWVKRFWLAPVSDDETSRADGFGLATIGVWGGEIKGDLF